LQRNVMMYGKAHEHVTLNTFMTSALYGQAMSASRSDSCIVSK